MPKVRKIPQRTCLGCQAVKPKRELVRIVRTPAGEVSIDPTGKKAGRGAYICPRRECLAGALAGNRLERALEISIPREVLEAIGGELARSVT
ncbi:MAG: RNase P modulator RnpM [Patescibacteria group bacterium]